MARLYFGSSRFATIAVTFALLAVASALIFGALWALEFAGEPDSPNLLDLWASPSAADMLANLGEVTVAILGIALTVVAILVQLAGYRYTPRITELFIRDPINMVAVGLFVVTAVLVLWVNMTLPAVVAPSPMVLALVGAVSVSILGLLPYFAYIFAFLAPGHIIGLIRSEITTALVRVRRRGEEVIPRSRAELVAAVEQLDDMAQNAVKKDDKAIAVRALAALAEALQDSLDAKPHLPAAWFLTGRLATRDADLIALHPSMIRSLEDRRIWVEMKIMRGLESTFRQALGRQADVTHLVAVHCRAFCARAREGGDVHALDLGLRYFNTFVRHTINAADMRSAYNVLNEHRETLGELLARGDDERVRAATEHLAYYAHLAFQRGHNFIVETIAQDLSELLMRAHGLGSSCHDAVLETFLEVDREPFLGQELQEASLRGVRKAQVRLATYYLHAGVAPAARRIYEDLRDEQPERLRSVWHELARVADAEWWEVANRDTNWDYLPPERRAQLDVFFGWFDGLGPSDEPALPSDRSTLP